MTILPEAIRGFSIGIEWVEEERAVILDLLVLRLIVFLEEKDDDF